MFGTEILFKLKYQWLKFRCFCRSMLPGLHQAAASRSYTVYILYVEVHFPRRRSGTYMVEFGLPGDGREGENYSELCLSSWRCINSRQVY